MIRQLVFVAAGGALGSVARYLLGLTLNAALPMRFPLATFVVNASGSFLIGVMYVLIAEKGVLHPDWRSVAMVGFLGGFTTFSTFSLETVTLLENGFALHALANVALGCAACVGSAWLAMTLTRLLLQG